MGRKTSTAWPNVHRYISENGPCREDFFLLTAKLVEVGRKQTLRNALLKRVEATLQLSAICKLINCKFKKRKQQNILNE